MPQSESTGLAEKQYESASYDHSCQREFMALSALHFTYPIPASGLRTSC
jgi:hypothetical protein